MVKDGIFLGKRYEVLSKIGAGGMADVYKGKDHMLNRYVAIKVLKKEFKEDENFVRKFRSEAQAAAGLIHPNVVNVYDVGEDRGLYYMVMELVEGITLKEYIDKKGRLSHKETISIAIQMCTGIGVAHAANIIHRDIKPQNIIISKDGKVKVTDFGIAKATTSNTISSNAMGSVHYTSPEQARGGFSDQKSDIYSIGITLYEMVTGQVPFDGDSTVSVAIKHLQEEITPPSEIVPDIPYSLEQIILKCTQKNGERRYKNTDELIQDLKRSLVDPDGDFVIIPPLGNADTVIITDEELDDIRSSYDEEDDFDEYDEDEYGDEEEFDEYDEDDDEYDEYDDDEEYGGKGKKGKGSDDVNPRMKKVMKILTIVVAIIIVFILVFAIGKAAGIFKGGFGIDTVDTDEKAKVKVPNVVGMTEDEAKKTLNKKGLGFKVVAREESKKYEEGTVSKQKTEAGKRVAKNTTIQVVVSSGLVGDEITVPNVSNMSESEAQKALEDAGFEKITSDFAYSDSVAEGDVIGTTPAANARATKDTEIVMKVSKGSEKKTVPNVVGQQDGDAQNAITAAGLTVGTVTYEYYDDVPKGQVVSQTVAGGKKVAPGTSVGLTISSGPKPPEKVSVPPVTGISIEEARALLDGVGLKADIKYDSETAGTVGQVIKCNPGVGTQVDEGSTVTLIVISKSSQPDGGETESTQ
ncbi:Stk1 family PASTA domain-containing Ser/Thr kinase [[Clostridium] scindens]|uniref:Stk1 family PASTA domain-containing Ser/Thr kinase n=1 Tax=Clostridium scindens (strain JCM 10418 / VPI 12708) TaxID=29347 RepID=UPI001D0872A1|nr:Stk1 family PASTA domain-containing Ser/Thr kinase [[Clostridium] scindens]MCB6286185.1 Stk1 family PASTA domain-containing Ser/Thr kinase [[Clostridium] scindens]MCB6420941.1 Stk1 family PASTA domain-containing Ser/Thr kinase [[Clostridium] scindens]MCB7192701.1 Stk1 family PASTA domain-containing Ser/Thr kinase [[Clostridium] scindens]MCB7285885.1 Stk1 family PASTA domain-containing Ser/Thr kinase [[Clostridium] scindens]MCG4930736.1 Stk1 family PASTA domain-containing Ser/Thr kinase [[Cl